MVKLCDDEAKVMVGGQFEMGILILFEAITFHQTTMTAKFALSSVLVAQSRR